MANRGQIPTNNSALIAMIADEGWALIIWVQELGFEFLSYFSYTMSGVKQSTLRKAIGALKDKTTVSLAKVHTDYKELDINLVKATNHVERPAKEQHIKTVFAYISGIRPRADIAYCIHALSRRLAKTHNWAVALKTLILIHRALREVDQTFHEELINYSRCKRHMLNMANFKDDSSPNAWDYSVWVRNYALFLEERLECMRVLKYDVEMDYPFCISVCTMVLLGAAWNGSCTDSPKQGRFLEQNQPRRWQNSLQEVQTP